MPSNTRFKLFIGYMCVQGPQMPIGSETSARCLPCLQCGNEEHKKCSEEHGVSIDLVPYRCDAGSDGGVLLSCNHTSNQGNDRNAQEGQVVKRSRDFSHRLVIGNVT